MTSSGFLRSRWTRIKQQQGREGLVNWAQQSCSSWSSSWLWPGAGSSWVSSATQCCFVSWGLGGGCHLWCLWGKEQQQVSKILFCANFLLGPRKGRLTLLSNTQGFPGESGQSQGDWQALGTYIFGGRKLSPDLAGSGTSLPLADLPSPAVLQDRQGSPWCNPSSSFSTADYFSRNFCFGQM